MTMATRELLASRDGWREGLADERLFRRWKTVPGGKRSWPLHLALVASEVAQLPFRPSHLGRVAGRVCATLGFGGVRQLTLGGLATALPQNFVNRTPQYSAAKSRAA